MRTGGDYRKALRDGRKVWVMGEGWVDEVPTHSATRAMVEEYALWYDRHLDPAWQELLLAPTNADGGRIPWAYVLPRSAADLIGMGRSFAKTTFLSAGNITHTPAYGNLIAMGVADRAVFFCLLRLAGKNAAHVDNRAGRFAQLLDDQRRLRL